MDEANRFNDPQFTRGQNIDFRDWCLLVVRQLRADGYSAPEQRVLDLNELLVGYFEEDFTPDRALEELKQTGALWSPE